jgi:hypothetical protein
MKSYRTKIVEGIEIISGFDQLAVDPEATRIKIDAALNKTEELKKYSAAVTKMKSIKPPELMKIRTKADQDKWGQILSKYSTAMASVKDEIISAQKELNVRYEKLRSEIVVYFEPRKGEIVPTDQLKLDALKTAAKALKPNQHLTPSGDIVVDERGTKFVLDDDNGIRACEIKKFGETKPEGAIDMEKLTPAQILKLQEAERLIHLGKMKPEEIEAEKIAKKQAAQQQAVEYRYKLELELEPDEARQKTKEFYNGLIEKIDSYYNIEDGV